MFEPLESRQLLAGNVLLVSNPGAFNNLPDDSALEQFLTSTGYTIDADSGTFTSGPPSATQLVDVDVILVSRATTSGDYADAGEAAAWNGLDVPIVLMNPYLARNSRWGWLNSATMVADITAPTNLDPFPDANHEFVAGASTSFFNSGTQTDFIGSTAVPAGATVVATITSGGNTGAMLVDIPAGASSFGGGTTGERRVLFSVSDYPDVAGVEFALSAGGQQILRNVLNAVAPIVQVPPTAPTDLAVSGLTQAQAVVRWTDQSDNELEFQIERRPASGGSFEQIATLTANVTSYADSGLMAEAGYLYRVRAANGAGESEYSNEFGIVTLSGASTTPVINGMTPAPGSLGVFLDRVIVADVTTPNGGINAATLTAETVKIYPSDDPLSSVELVLNTSGGGDIIVARPAELLEPNTNYTFEVTSGLTDFIGVGFEPYLATFRTGSETNDTDASISFERVELDTVPIGQYSGLAIGPDGKLYAGTPFGDLVRWTILSDGTLGPLESLPGFRNANGEDRLLIGIEFDPNATAENLILWATHTTFGFSGVPDFGGKLTRLTGPNLEDVQDYIVNLPRSARDHVTNQMDFGPDGAIYFLQGSNSAMGSPDSSWSNRPEHLLTAALLRFDPDDYDPMAAGGPLDVRTDGVADPYNPFAPGAPLTVYASGIRNAFDLVWHSNGELYVPVNGSASGGGSPATPAVPTEGLLPRIDEDINGPYTGPAVPSISNVATQPDLLFRIEQFGYYGHPNPTRNEFVLNGGNPTAGVDPLQVTEYPVGTLPDRNYRGVAFNFGTNFSPDGILEYSYSGAFGGALAGKLLVARFSAGDDIIVLETDEAGNIIGSNDSIASFDGFNDPLDLVENRLNGNLYVSEYSWNVGMGGIVLLRPQEPDISLSGSEFYFNDPAGGGASNTQTITISNLGDGSLALPAGAIHLGGTDAGQFTIVSGGQATTILPGESHDVAVAFAPTSVGVKAAILIIESNDADTPLLDVSLRGLAHSGFQGGGEATLAQIMQLFELPVDVGFTSLTTPYSTALLGDELLMPQLEKAGDSPVIIEPLATFGPAATPDYRIGWYEPGATPTLHQLAEIESLNPVAGGDGQTVNPIVSSGATTFDPGSEPFGLYGEFPSMGDQRAYTEDALNVFDLGRRKFRFWPLRNEAGAVVPNAFVVGVEEATNNDLNDVVFIIRNARPVVPLLGDYNLDSTVDAADYVTWRYTLGQQVSPYTGADGNGDGVINQFDHAVWRENFGATLMGSASSALPATAAVSHELLATEVDRLIPSAVDAAFATIDYETVTLRPNGTKSSAWRRFDRTTDIDSASTRSHQLLVARHTRALRPRSELGGTTMFHSRADFELEPSDLTMIADGLARTVQRCDSAPPTDFQFSESGLRVLGLHRADKSIR